MSRGEIPTFSGPKRDPSAVEIESRQWKEIFQQFFFNRKIMIQSTPWATFFGISALCRLVSSRGVTSQIVIMTKTCPFYMLDTKNSPARCEIDTDFIPTVLDSLLLVEFRKTIGISIANLFLRQTVILLSYLQKIWSNYGIFVDFLCIYKGKSRILKVV